MIQQILEKQRILEKPLERFGKRDGKSSLAFIRCLSFELLEVLTDFEPLVRVLLFRFFGGAGCGEGIVDLFKCSFEMEYICRVTMEDM